MDSKLFAVCGIVALLLVGSSGAVASGLDGGPADRGPNGGTYGPGPAAPGPSAPATGSDDGGSDVVTDRKPFTVVAENTEKCGRTCRDVTSTVTNRQDTIARDVGVSTQIYAGRDANGNVVWQGSERVGTLEADGSHSATKRIKLSFGDAWAVKRAGGWITIETTVQTADQTVTLTERRKVA